MKLSVEYGIWPTICEKEHYATLYTIYYTVGHELYIAGREMTQDWYWGKLPKNWIVV